MTTQEDQEVLELIREAIKKARGYADFFGWGSDRDIEEWGVVTALAESLEAEDKVLFTDIKSRGRGNDPPDCEALDSNGNRLAIEVTELVDGTAIQAYKKGSVYEWADWKKESFLDTLEELLARKNFRYPKLKELPYEGGYIVVIYTGEPMLDPSTVELYLHGHEFKKLAHVTSAFLLVSYDPGLRRCPHYKLRIDG